MLLFVLGTLLIPSRDLHAGASPFLAGKLLVAASDMGDPRFVQTVIYMVQHDKNGAMGLVINRPLATGPVQKFLRGFRIEAEGACGNITVHYGGPVAAQRAFVLHSDDYVTETTRRAGRGVAVTADATVLRAIADGDGPQRSLVVVGYAGWAAGQLEREIKAKAWRSVSADPGLIFDGDPTTKWKRAMAKVGVGI